MRIYRVELYGACAISKLLSLIYLEYNEKISLCVVG